MLEHALNHLKNGYSVIPIQKGDKKPLVQSWTEYQKRLPTETEVTSWWTKWPDANIAIITGLISKLTVVDFDVKKDASGNPIVIDGKPQISEHVKKFNEPTMVVRTGSGGYHYYFNYCQEAPQGVDVFGGNSGVDIRNDGGYVVTYPSVHKNGNTYDLITDEYKVDFPQIVFSSIKPKKEALDLVSVPQGSRNNSMASFIGKLLISLKPFEWNDVAYPIIEQVNKTYTPPLDRHELNTIYKSIANTELARRSNEKMIDVTEDNDEEVNIVLVKEAAETDLTQGEYFSTGIKVVDDALGGGIQDGDLTVISGQTGQGKTLTAQSITHSLAINKIPCLWFSYEVRPKELWFKFKNMGVPEEFITYTPIKMKTGNLDWIEDRIKKAKDQFKSRVVFIDHLGFLTQDIKNGLDKNLANNYALYLGSICRQLKRIALQQNVSIVLLVHTKKAERGRSSSEIGDIAYSGGIAQESDTVLMVSRKIDPTKNSEDVYTNETELLITKNRKTGLTKRIVMEFHNGKLVPMDMMNDPYVKELTKIGEAKTPKFSDLNNRNDGIKDW